MKLILTTFSIFLVSLVFGQVKNPAEKYINSYKKYLNAKCPLNKDEIRHFVYFARSREQIINHPFLELSRFKGAQIMYAWKQLEPEKDVYNFDLLEHDIEYLARFGKQLFVQLQDATFNPGYKALPDYLLTKEFSGGVVPQRTDDGIIEGWVAKRWNKNVQERFVLLLEKLGNELDGKIEGINLQESAIGVTEKDDKIFSPEIYVATLKENMLSLKKAFPKTVTMQYANFMPGEWLPWEDNDYLRSVYKYANEIGVGLGAPDLMPRRKGQLNHALALMHETNYNVPLGIAVQDGNYIGETNNDETKNDRKNLVPYLHAFAKDFLRVDYMFWVVQEPYFSEDVIPCFTDY